MVELNEKALEAAHHAYQTHEQMGHLKAQRLSDSCLTAVITAYFSTLPEEVVFCPNCGWNSAMDGPALPAPDDGLVERLQIAADGVEKVSFERRSLRRGYENILREAAAALQSQAEQIERLEREKDDWKDACMQAREGCNQRSDTIRSLLSRLSRAMEAMTPSADTQAAYTNRIQIGVELRAGDEVEFRSLFIPWNGIRGIMDAIRTRAARETEGGK